MPTLSNQEGRHLLPSNQRKFGGGMTTRASAGSDDGRTVRPLFNSARFFSAKARKKIHRGPLHMHAQPGSRTTRTSPHQRGAISSPPPNSHMRRSPFRCRPTSRAAHRSLRPFRPRPTPRRAPRGSSVSRCAGCAGRSGAATALAPARRRSCVASRTNSCGGCAARTTSWS